MKFPKTLAWRHMNQKGVYELVESVGEDYAFYKHDLGFGFKHGITIARVFVKDKSKSLYRVRELSGNSWGKGTWLICNEKFFKTLEDAIAHLNGETRVYRPKRKPELIRPMTTKEVKEYFGI